MSFAQASFNKVLFLTAVVGMMMIIFISAAPPAGAADNNFADGITVDSNGDAADALVGNGICDDGSGNCTLRAAIEEANSAAGAQTINFNITGTADFTNGGQNGYTITPATMYPTITGTTVIDGYSQPGSRVNTAISPNPVNARILIEIDGDGLNQTSFQFDNAANSAVRGLAIGDFGYGVGVIGDSDNVAITGNFFGIRPTGAPLPIVDTAVAMNEGSDGCQIGGVLPEERNVIGNAGVGIILSAYSLTLPVEVVGGSVQGNYFGVAPDGITAAPLTLSAISNAATNILIGGQTAAAGNVIVNSGTGISLEDASGFEAVNSTIQGNRIGLLYDGSDAGSTVGISVRKFNPFGTPLGYQLIGGVNPGSGNTISGNTAVNVLVFGATGIVMQGNRIGTNSSASVDSGITNGIGVLINGASNELLVGGTSAGAGNIIAGNRDGGILNASYSIPGPTTFNSSNNTFLGNAIFENAAGVFPGTSGLGIDHLAFTDADLNGSPDAFSEVGPTMNDVDDTDPGPNEYMNFPVLHSAAQVGTQMTVNMDLDAAGTTDPSGLYRVEFFANDAADPSGYGEGQVYLGYANVANGDNQEVVVNLPGGIDLSGKSLTATTTAINSATTSGFGSTSEFSEANDAITVSNPGNDVQLAATGDNSEMLWVIALSLVVASSYFVFTRRSI